MQFKPAVSKRTASLFCVPSPSPLGSHIEPENREPQAPRHVMGVHHIYLGLALNSEAPNLGCKSIFGSLCGHGNTATRQAASLRSWCCLAAIGVWTDQAKQEVQKGPSACAAGLRSAHMAVKPQHL
jgi:hypothetical protein